MAIEVEESESRGGDCDEVAVVTELVRAQEQCLGREQNPWGAPYKEGPKCYCTEASERLRMTRKIRGSRMRLVFRCQLGLRKTWHLVGSGQGKVRQAWQGTRSWVTQNQFCT